MRRALVRATSVLHVLLCAAVAASCKDATAPDASARLGRVELNPDTVMLWLEDADQSVSLTVTARTRGGELLSTDDIAVTYASSAPAVARVSDGMVVAHSPGRTRITATVTWQGVSETAEATVTVMRRIGGTYHLTSQVGDGFGVTVTAVLELKRVPGTAQLTGTYSDYTIHDPGGSSHSYSSGVVQGWTGIDGRVALELTNGGYTVWVGEGFMNADSESITGRFKGAWEWFENTGTFQADPVLPRALAAAAGTV